MLDTDDLVYDDNQQVCQDLGGFLPEPRDERENQFLFSLDAETFSLGMTDRLQEGEWLWDSDGQPVTWTKWISKEPNGKNRENCVAVWTDGEWQDVSCLSNHNIRARSTRLICQRNPGEWTLLREAFLLAGVKICIIKI